jgi:hypothetical protein
MVALTVTVDPPLSVTVLSPVVVKVWVVDPTKFTSPIFVHAPGMAPEAATATSASLRLVCPPDEAVRVAA